MLEWSAVEHERAAPHAYLLRHAKKAKAAADRSNTIAVVASMPACRSPHFECGSQCRLPLSLAAYFRHLPCELCDASPAAGKGAELRQTD